MMQLIEKVLIGIKAFLKSKFLHMPLRTVFAESSQTWLAN